MKKIRGVLHISVLVLTFWGAHRVISKRYAAPLPKKITLNLDPHFPQTFKNKVLAFAKEHEKVSLTAPLLHELISYTFPEFESVIVKNYIDDHVKVSLKGAYPVARVNNDLVLTSNNTLAYMSTYPQQECKDLPLFYVAQSTKDKQHLYLTDACKQFIKTCDPALLHEYEVQWVANTLIQLRDRSNAKLTLLIDGKTRVTPEIKTAYARIRDKKMQQQTRSKKGRGWFVDARFRNQMIVFLRGEKT